MITAITNEIQKHHFEFVEETSISSSPATNSFFEIARGFLEKQQQRIQFRVTVEDPESFCNEIIKKSKQTKLKREVFIDHYYDNENFDLLKNSIWFRTRILLQRDNIGFPLKKYSLKLVTKKHDNNELFVQEATNSEKIFESAGVEDLQKSFPDKYIYYECNRIYLVEQKEFSVHIDQTQFREDYHFSISCTVEPGNLGDLEKYLLENFGNLFIDYSFVPTMSKSLAFLCYSSVRDPEFHSPFAKATSQNPIVTKELVDLVDLWDDPLISESFFDDLFPREEDSDDEEGEQDSDYEEGEEEESKNVFI